MNTRARGIAISTVGYMAVAIGGWMLSMTAAQWYTRALSPAFLVPLTLVLGIMGILAFVADRGLDSVVFFGFAAVMGSIATYTSTVFYARAIEPLTYIGWYAGMFAIYFICTWAGSFRSGATRSVFLLGLWLTLGVLAIGGWTGVTGWMIAGGYLGLITSVIAFAVAGSEMVRNGRLANPNEEILITSTTTTTSTARPMAAD